MAQSSKLRICSHCVQIISGIFLWPWAEACRDLFKCPPFGLRNFEVGEDEEYQQEDSEDDENVWPCQFLSTEKNEYLKKCENNEKTITVSSVFCNVSIPQHTGSTFPPRSWQTSWRNQRQRRQKAGDLDWRVLPQWTMGLGLVRSRKMPQNWRWRQCWHMTSTSLDPAQDN